MTPHTRPDPQKWQGVGVRTMSDDSLALLIAGKMAQPEHVAEYDRRVALRAKVAARTAFQREPVAVRVRGHE